MRRPILPLLLLAMACSDKGASKVPPTTTGDTLRVTPTFTFESGPVRPLALSSDGARLYAANTANGSLDILTVTDAGLSVTSSVFTGIDPVALAERVPGEVWVVNHVSDSVSIVDTTSNPPHVVRTLLVGDEPSDIVFAGGRAFITTAHRGQQRVDPSISGVPGAGDPQLTTPGVGRADVWVFDGNALGTTVGGTPAAIVTLFGDTPRGLAVTPDGKTVYAAIFKSGNQTMATSSETPCAGFDSPGVSTPCVRNGVDVPGAPPGPGTNHAGVKAPAVAVMLKADSAGVWRDVLGRDWSSLAMFSLPDQDVFALDATTLATKAIYTHVGTTLFNLAVNPANGHLYVSNTEARNELRFEGPGTYAGETLQGHLAESRITVIDGSAIKPRHLNKHLNYGQLPAPADAATHSLSTPLNIVVSPDGATVYVSAFGSSKIGVLPASTLENDSFDPTTASSSYINVSGGGPSGLVLDAARNRLYVATRFDDGVVAVDLVTKAEVAHVQLTNPEPSAITTGRKFLYDANLTSSNGEAACASCHMFGDQDHLAWDLGDPDADVVTTAATIKLSRGAPASINGTGKVAELHPLKGPMTTQTLRGLTNHGAMHWRGDRTSGAFGTDTSVEPPYDSELSFNNFIVAFSGLLGRAENIATADMQAFTAFAFGIVMPPNPVRDLDNQLTFAQANGQAFYLGCDGTSSIAGTSGCDATGHGGHFSDGVTVSGLGFTCEGCHVLDSAQGFFGTDGSSSFESLPQTVKIPQLRNLYDKIGMFGVSPSENITGGGNGFKGPQVRGSGFEHDGSIDTLFRFLSATVFESAQGGKVGFARGDDQRRDVEQYLLAFDNDLAPIVGQQVTLRSDNAAAVKTRIDLLIARAGTPFVSKILGGNVTECDLVARTGSATYKLEGAAFITADGTSITDTDLRALAATPGQEVTYTCLPPGWTAAPQ